VITCLNLGKIFYKVAITLRERSPKAYMGGSLDGAEKKVKERKHREGGLTVLHVERKMDLSLVVEKMLQRVEKEDAAQLVPHVKLTKGGKENELEKYFKNAYQAGIHRCFISER
jgi:hypothetical protein